MKSFLARAKPFVDAGALTHAETETLARIAPRFGETDTENILGLAFVAAAHRLGHVVLSLVDAPRLWAARTRAWLPQAPTGDMACELEFPGDSETLPWPRDTFAWHHATLRSPLVGEGKPFAAVGHSSGVPMLTTQRRCAQETSLASMVRARAAQTRPPPEHLDALVETFFPGDSAGEAATAVRVSMVNSLAIITGGPGTGKTYSITRLLATLALSETREEPLVVRLAAPTGKAAARMGEAILEGIEALKCAAIPAALLDRLASLKAETVHALLGATPDGTTRFNAANPIRASLVVVDEASMVDVALMRVLFAAVPASARLVLLGDPDQLASVEAGAVLGDLVRSSVLGHCRVHFTRSRRFESAPTLAACAGALQSPLGGALASPGLLVSAAAADARHRDAMGYLLGRCFVPADPLPQRIAWLGPGRGPGGFVSREQLDALAAPYRASFLPKLRAISESSGESELAELLGTLDDYRVLAVHRRGTLSVETIAEALERELLGPIFPRAPADHHPRLRHGLPILVTASDKAAGLVNGEVGLAVALGNELTCIFPGLTKTTVKHVAPARLTTFESALAMTVHKAQGSQFRRVALVMPHGPSPIQTRELVYTALTRARESVVWVGSEAQMSDALLTRTERFSGLAHRLE